MFDPRDEIGDDDPLELPSSSSSSPAGRTFFLVNSGVASLSTKPDISGQPLASYTSTIDDKDSRCEYVHFPI